MEWGAVSSGVADVTRDLSPYKSYFGYCSLLRTGPPHSIQTWIEGHGKEVHERYVYRNTSF